MKKIVFTFGRFNPPTTGHYLLANKVKEEARRRGAENAIYGSSTQDKDKNPLNPREKLRFMKKVLKGFNVIVNQSANTPFIVLKQLSDAGYGDVTMVVGSDRVSEFKRAVSKYVGPDKEFKFSNFEVISAGERDPDAEGVGGMSASKMRAAVKGGNFQAFKLGIPSHVSIKDTTDMFKALAKGMKVKPILNENEWFDYDEFKMFYEDFNSSDDNETDKLLQELNIQARRKLGMRMKRTAKKRAVSRKRKEKRRKTKPELKVKARKQAISKIKKKLTKGMKWQDVPFKRREKIDAMVKKKKSAIARISKKLFPAVQKSEKERLAKVRERMTTGDPAKAVSENVIDGLFNNYLSEASNQQAKERLVDKEKNKGAGVSTPNERDAARKRGERKAEGGSGKPRWSNLMLIRDNKEKIKLILSTDYVEATHEIVLDKGKVTQGTASKAAKDPNWDWTETAKQVMVVPKDETKENKPKELQSKESGGVDKPTTPEQEKLVKTQAKLDNKKAQTELDTLENEPEEQKQAALEQEYQERKNKLKKSSIELLYPDSEHKAIDLKAGVVHMWNDMMGVKSSVGGISKTDKQKINDSLTLSPSARRIVDQIKDQIGEGFEAVQYIKEDKPLSGDWKDSDTTPKTDIILKNNKSGESLRVSVKVGKEQLMSTKNNEAKSTFKSILESVGDDIRKETSKDVGKITGKMLNFISTALGSIPGGKVLESAVENLHEKITKELQDLFENNTTFGKALTKESLSGENKFGGSDASATHILSMNEDGTNSKLNIIDEKYVDSVSGDINPIIKFKPSQEEGEYSYWNTMKLLTSSAFAGIASSALDNLTASNVTMAFGEFNVLYENSNDPRQYLKNATEWIGNDPEKLKEFLGLEVEGIDTNEINLADNNVNDSGQYNDITVDGKEMRISVGKDIKYYDPTEDELSGLNEKFNVKMNSLKNEHLYEFKKSKKHGLGSFATGNIKEGKRISLFLLDLLEEDPTYQRTDICRLTNHSKFNNIELKEEKDGNFYVYATKDIQEGEELLINYFNIKEIIMPILNNNGQIITEVLRWTTGYEGMEIPKDTFSDLKYELEYLESIKE
tara:strand:+ start:3495 stop:6740 length:3246 start_codon:yes stop_codon:yes gene_type:complete